MKDAESALNEEDSAAMMEYEVCGEKIEQT